MFGQLPGGSGEDPGNGGSRIDVYSCCRLLYVGWPQACL